MATKEHPNGYYSHNRVMEIARGCKDFADFRNNHGSAREAAQANGWIDDVKAVLPHKTYWNRELVEQEIKNKGYKNKKEFREGSPGAYSHAAKRGFLDEVCKDMEVLGHLGKRKIYVYEFEDGYAYVGLTDNLDRRNYQHLNDGVSPVGKHYKKTGARYEWKIISDWLTKEEAQIYEDEMINAYAEEGWKMLNTKKGGSLGGGQREPMYSMEELKAAVATCTRRVEFRRKFPSMYEFLLRHHLKEEVLGHLPQFYMPPIYWTDERLKDLVEQCGHDRQKLRERSSFAYNAICRRGLIETFFGSRKVYNKGRTEQSAIDECKKYKSVKEVRENNPDLYSYIIHHHIRKECFKDMEKMEMHDDYTWDDIEAAINASKNLTQMRKEHTHEYRAALRKEEWRRELYHRLPSRKHKSNET